MSKLTLNENRLMIKEGFTSADVLRLDELRLVYLFLPESLKSWFVVTSTSGIEAYDLDTVADDNIEQLNRRFDQMTREEKASKLYGIKLVLADYEKRKFILPLKDFKAAGIDIFNQLYLHWKQR